MFLLMKADIFQLPMSVYSRATFAKISNLTKQDVCVIQNKSLGNWENVPLKDNMQQFSGIKKCWHLRKNTI